MKARTRSLLLIGLAACATSLGATPKIIFISENTPAQLAMQTLVGTQYDAEQREAIRLSGDLEAWAAYEAVGWSGMARSLRNNRYAALKAALGLEDTDPADKGFTDLLTAAGYDVHRSWTVRESDPITGATTATHEFHGEIGEPFSATGDHRLSDDQIARLSAADLIIVSRDITTNRYAWSGREAGAPSMVLTRQWNNLAVPIIVMDPVLAVTNEFGSYGWGLNYGFTGNWNTIGSFDRRAVPAEQRFVFPDLRPAVRQHDPDLLAGVELADGNRVALYKDYSQFPVLPQTLRKFSNNKNYVFPANAKVVLELLFPTFVDLVAGEIEHQNPVIIEFQKGVAGFTPQDGVPTADRVGTPAETRLHFAAGMTTNGLYNLGPAGEQVLLNAVAKYAGEAGGGGEDPLWHGYLIGEGGLVDTGADGWFMGTVNVTHDPWVWSHALGQYVYVPDASGWMHAGALAGGGEGWLGYPAWGDFAFLDGDGWMAGYVNIAHDPWVWSYAFGKYLNVPDASGWVFNPPPQPQP